MTIFSCNGLTKRFDRAMLFEDISFGMESGERLGLIGRNGIGKTTLLRIIAGREAPDSGSVVFNSAVHMEYLEQIPSFESEEPIIDAVMNAKPQLYSLLEEHNRLCSLPPGMVNENISRQLQDLNHKIDHMNGWNLENDARTFLTRLGVTEFHKNINQLSGGQKKRVALSRALLSDPGLLILDEPTNHLDADSVQWLQDRLMASGVSIIFVTHDRYFLDAVATRIIELDKQRIFSHPGNYEKYLERKEAFESIQNSTSEHNRTKLRTELAWLQRGARARRTKQKSRIDWIEKIKADSIQEEERKFRIELGKTFLHSRVIDAHNVSKSIGGKLLFKNFTYLAKPGDRIGIIGPNGTGKSTLLNVLTERVPPDSGSVKTGPSVKIGYFTQESLELSPMQSVIGSLREIAEFIDTGIGRERFITCRELLNKFMFPHQQHSSLISTLSGGEKRRLALLRVLMNNPNVILLDEPTNDLDINTLGVLEDYLDDFYGVLLIVSHDRAFLDRTVNFIWAFEEDGNIKEYPGNYSAYLEKKEIARQQKNASAAIEKENKQQREKQQQPRKKLSYMEQREFDELEKSIPVMEAAKKSLQEELNLIEYSDYKLIDTKSRELAELDEKIEEATMRWLELSEKV